MNRACSIPNGFPIELSKEVTIRKVRGDDLATITEHDNQAATYLHGGKFTLTIDNFDVETSKEELSRRVLCALYALNMIAEGSAIAVNKAFILKQHRKLRIARMEDLSHFNHAHHSNFQITAKDDLKYAANLFNAVSEAVASHAPMRLTIARLNSAIGRVALDEKIVDLCISLESVFQSQNEIAFQFALYNTILAEGDTNKRLDVFKTLKKLYTQRSNIVHGNKAVDEAWCEESMPRLLTVAKTAVLQKVEYLTRENHESWKAHIEKLALGIS